MRFDANGAMTFIEGFQEPRPLGSDGERRGADRVAAGLEDAGFLVERVAAQPGWLPKSLVGTFLLALLLPWPALPFLLWYLIAVDALVPDYSVWVRLGLPFLMITAIGDALWFRVRAAMGHAAQAASNHVIARDPVDEARPARLLIVTSIVTARQDWLPLLEKVLLGIGVYPIVKYLISPESRQFESLGMLTIDLVVPWLALLVLAHGVPIGPPRPRHGDNRTGLGLIVELARAWSRPARERVELWLIATPDAADLNRSVADRWRDGKPTIALGLDAPGVGPTIRIAGRGAAAALVDEVANSLWLPHQTSRGLGHDPIARSWSVPGVSLASVGGERGDQPIDPALLAAVAQLIHEVALRWGKPAPAQPLSGESAARSFQKPG